MVPKANLQATINFNEASAITLMNSTHLLSWDPECVGTVNGKSPGKDIGQYLKGRPVVVEEEASFKAEVKHIFFWKGSIKEKTT